MLIAREELRSHPLVVDALHKAWDLLVEARGGASGQSIEREAYIAMFRKTYLLFKAQRREGYLEAESCLAEVRTMLGASLSLERGRKSPSLVSLCRTPLSLSLSLSLSCLSLQRAFLAREPLSPLFSLERPRAVPAPGRACDMATVCERVRARGARAWDRSGG